MCNGHLPFMKGLYIYMHVCVYTFMFLFFKGEPHDGIQHTYSLLSSTDLIDSPEILFQSSPVI